MFRRYMASGVAGLATFGHAATSPRATEVGRRTARASRNRHGCGRSSSMQAGASGAMGASLGLSLEVPQRQHIDLSKGRKFLRPQDGLKQV